jgi:hypothetical protein
MSKRHGICIFVLLLCLYSYFIHFWPTFHTANESIRLYYVQAVVEQQTPYIDGVMRRYQVGNIDAALHEGRKTLDKSPGLSYSVVPVYWLLTRMGVSTERQHVHQLYFLLTLAGVIIPALFGLYWVGRSTQLLTRDVWASWTAALIVGLATPYALYSTLFFGHVPAAALAAGALYHLLARKPAVAGVLAGGMVLMEGSSVVVAAGLGVFSLLQRQRPRDVVVFALCASPLIGLYLLHNAWLFGDPLVFGYARKANPAFAAFHGQGLLGITVGSKRGLFFHSPILLLALPGLALLGQAGERRRYALVLGALAGLHLLWISGFVDWPAGDSYAARHLILLIPLLGIGIGSLLGSASPGQSSGLLTRWALPLLLGFSWLAAWTPAATFPYAPPGFEMPLLQLNVPLLLSGHGSPSVGRLLGLPEALSPLGWLLLFTALLAVLFRAPERRPTLLAVVKCVAGCALLLGLLWGGRPEDTDSSNRDRILVECLLGHQASAAARCHQIGGQFRPRSCHCKLRRRSRR